MKERLITNGILSIISFIVDVLLFIYYDDSSTLILSRYSQWWIVWIPVFFANFIMGVLTLSMKKHKAAKGLTVASGILAILNGVFLINVLISFIGVAKINKYEKSHKNDFDNGAKEKLEIKNIENLEQTVKENLDKYLKESVDKYLKEKSTEELDKNLEEDLEKN